MTYWLYFSWKTFVTDFASKSERSHCSLAVENKRWPTWWNRRTVSCGMASVLQGGFLNRMPASTSRKCFVCDKAGKPTAIDCNTCQVKEILFYTFHILSWTWHRRPPHSIWDQSPESNKIATCIRVLCVAHEISQSALNSNLWRI